MSKRLRAALLVCMLFCVTLLGAVFAACTPTDKKPDDGGKEPETPVEGVYSVTVEDSEGNPMSGIQVQMCDTNDLCLLPVATDENGVAKIGGTEEGMTYHIQIANWSTITAEYPDASYDEITTTAGVYAYTLVVTLGEKVEVVSYTFKVVDGDGKAVAGATLAIMIGENPVIATSNSQGEATITLPAGAEVPEEGFSVSVTAPEGYFYAGETVNTNDADKTITLTAGGGNFGTRRTVYLNGRSVDEYGLPVSEQVDMYFLTGADEYDIYATSGDEVFYTFQTTTEGKYSIYVEGGDGVITEYGTYNSGNNSFWYSVVDENEDMDSFDFEINEENAANINSSFQTFSVKVTAGSYPVSVKLIVERTGDADPIPGRIDGGDVHAKQAPDEKYGEQDGVLVEVDSKTPAKLVLADDGYYHLGTAEGPVVVVKLTGASRFLFDGRDLVNVEADGNKLLHPAVFDEEQWAWIDYNYTPFVQDYTNVVNSDGVVPLTEEMAEFLQGYQDRAGYPIYPDDPYGEAVEGYGWYLFLYYYDAEVKDFEEGKGTEADPYVISEAGVYGHTLEINAQTYVFLEGFCSWDVLFAALGEGGMDVAVNGVTLGQNDYNVVTTPFEVFDGEYGFMLEIIYGSRMTDAPDTIDIEFTVVADPTFGTSGNEYELVVGENYVSTAGGNFFVSFTAPYTGNYTFDATSGGLIGNTDTASEPFEGDLLEFEMEAGVTYDFVLYGAGHESQGFTFTLVVTFEPEALEGSGTADDPYIIPGEGSYWVNVPAGGTPVYYQISGSEPMYVYTQDSEYEYETVGYTGTANPYLGGFYTIAEEDQTFSLSSTEGYLTMIGVEAAPHGSEVRPLRVSGAGAFFVELYDRVRYMYVDFTAPESGTYTLYTNADTIAADAYDANGGYMEKDITGNGYAFEAEAGKTYSFGIKPLTSLYEDQTLIETAYFVKGVRDVEDDDEPGEDDQPDYETGDPADSNLKIGPNTVTSGGWNDNLMTFIPAEAGTYTFSTTDEAAVLMVIDDSGATTVIDPTNPELSSSYTVELKANQVLTLSISDVNGDSTYSWTLTISKA